MKTIFVAGLFILLFAFGLPSPAKADVNVGFSLDFHDALAPYGTWVHVSACDDCWRPSAPQFVPFTMGHWVYTSYGPTWEGDEPWAWAPYHYGQWIFTAQYGWIWQPGYEWNPGNVTWAYGDDYIGWCPISGANTVDTNLWVVVQRDNFLAQNYASVRVRPETVRTLFTRQAVRVSSAPLERAQVERIVRHPITVQAVREHDIEVNHHRTRVVATQERDAAVVKHINEVSAASGKANQQGDNKHQNSKKENDKKKKEKPPQDQSPNKDQK